jgi:hypothetical protein
MNVFKSIIAPFFHTLNSLYCLLFFLLLPQLCACVWVRLLMHICRLKRTFNLYTYCFRINSSKIYGAIGCRLIGAKIFKLNSLQHNFLHEWNVFHKLRRAKKNFYVLVVVEDNWKIALFIERCEKSCVQLNALKKKSF